MVVLKSQAFKALMLLTLALGAVLPSPAEAGGSHGWAPVRRCARPCARRCVRPCRKRCVRRVRCYTVTRVRCRARCRRVC